MHRACKSQTCWKNKGERLQGAQRRFIGPIVRIRHKHAAAQPAFGRLEARDTVLVRVLVHPHTGGSEFAGVPPPTSMAQRDQFVITRPSGRSMHGNQG